MYSKWFILIALILRCLKMDVAHSSVNHKLSLKAELMPSSFQGTKMQDLVFNLLLKNEGKEKIKVYPKSALLGYRIGWAGPVFLMNADQNGREHTDFLQELRLQYGPPGIPPVWTYFKKS